MFVLLLRKNCAQQKKKWFDPSTKKNGHEFQNVYIRPHSAVNSAHWDWGMRQLLNGNIILIGKCEMAAINWEHIGHWKIPLKQKHMAFKFHKWFFSCWDVAKPFWELKQADMKDYQLNRGCVKCVTVIMLKMWCTF